MKGRHLFILAWGVLVSCLIFGSAEISHAYSVFYNDEIANVGSVDKYISSDKLSNSGEETEQNWVESVLGFKVEFVDKNEFNSKSMYSWIQVHSKESSIYALYMPEEPDYFLIKTGNNKKENSGLEFTHFLFENIKGLDWAVVNLACFGDDYTIKNIGKLSHLVGYDDIVSAPEPSALLLLGFGLIALSFVARCRRRC